MSRRSLNAAVVLSALAVCACSVYGSGDLLGTDTFGDGGSGGRGGASGTGSSGGRGGTGTGGFLSAGAGGKAAGGNAAGGTGASSTGGATGGSGANGGANTGGKATTTGGDDSGGAGSSTGGSNGGFATGGGTPTGGAATGGAATGGSAPLVPELIDDMEDGDQNIVINPSEMRNGAWYTAVGKGGTADPAPMKTIALPLIVGTPGVSGSLRAFHFIGSGGTEWGAMAAFDFKANVSGAKVPYDAGTYKGITFWAKAAEPSQIQVRIPMPDTTSGVCATDGCENHFAAKVALTTDWKQFTLPWLPAASSVFLQDPSWGYKTDFDQHQILSVQFVVTIGTSADFWIDEVWFIPP